jgi:hypothetical protein
MCCRAHGSIALLAGSELGCLRFRGFLCQSRQNINAHHRSSGFQHQSNIRPLSRTRSQHSLITTSQSLLRVAASRGHVTFFFQHIRPRRKPEPLVGSSPTNLGPSATSTFLRRKVGHKSGQRQRRGGVRFGARRCWYSGCFSTLRTLVFSPMAL